MSNLDHHGVEIIKLLSHGVAKAAIARMYDSSWQTVHNWVRWKVMVRLVGKEQHDHMRNQGKNRSHLEQIMVRWGIQPSLRNRANHLY